jgi:hypothetical protein
MLSRADYVCRFTMNGDVYIKHTYIEYTCQWRLCTSGHFLSVYRVIKIRLITITSQLPCASTFYKVATRSEISRTFLDDIGLLHSRYVSGKLLRARQAR